MQTFYINKGSVNNTLRMELVKYGKYDFLRSDFYNNAIQNADITFSMWDENDVLKISKQPCSIILTETDTCEPHYVIEYQWNKRDVKDSGIFKGRFEISFKGDLYEDGVSYPTGNLIMPIHEDLVIMIK